MIKHYRYSVNPLPVIPEKATFMINNKFAYEEDNILFLWNSHQSTWASTNVSLEDYNAVYTKESHELTTWKEILLDRFSNMSIYQWAWKHKVNDGELFLYRQWNGTIEASYNKPVIKGTKGTQQKTRYCAGETIVVYNPENPEEFNYPQLLDMFGDNDVVYLQDGEAV